jgi:hypothetical protein
LRSGADAAGCRELQSCRHEQRDAKSGRAGWCTLEAKVAGTKHSGILQKI